MLALADGREMEAQLNGDAPYYLPALLRDYRRLLRLVATVRQPLLDDGLITLDEYRALLDVDDDQ